MKHKPSLSSGVHSRSLFPYPALVDKTDQLDLLQMIGKITAN